MLKETLNISLSIENPDSKPADQPQLYIGRQNRLNFLFSNSLGIPAVKPGDIFTINIPDNLIATASADQLIGDSWKAKDVTHQNGYYSYYFTPLKQLDFNGVLTISLDKLTSNIATNGDVSCSIYVGANITGPNVKLFASQPISDKAKALQKEITPTIYVNQVQQEVNGGAVFTSPTETSANRVQLSPPIANQVHINLKLNGSQLLNKPWSARPRFMFSFSYGSNGNDLTDALKSSHQNYNPLTSAWNIQARIGEDQADQWRIQPLNSYADTPVWIVEPTPNNLYLFTNAEPDLDIFFDHVISALAPYNTSVYIQWAGIPGYNPGRFVLNLPKQVPTPKVLEFTSSSLNFGPQDLVNLDWRTFGIPEVELCWDDIDKTLGGKFLLPVYPAGTQPALTYSGTNKLSVGRATPPFQTTESCYICSLVEAGGPQSGTELTITLGADSSPIIEQFDVVINMSNSGSTLEITWLVNSDNVNLYCELNLVNEPLPLQGDKGAPYTITLPINSKNPLPPELQLTVKGFYPEVSKVLKLQYKMVQSLPGVTVYNISPRTNTVFLYKDGNQLACVNALAPLADFTTLDQTITFGTQSYSPQAVYANPKGTEAFVTVYPTDNVDEIMYFIDTTNIPAVATREIDLEGYSIESFLSSNSSIVFSEDGNTVFCCGQKVNLPIAISFFDVDDPPAALPQQLTIPSDLKVQDVGINMIVLPTKNEALVYPLSLNQAADTVPLYRFSTNDLPTTLKDPITYSPLLFSLKISPNGETAFGVFDDDDGNPLKIGFYPTNAPPAKVNQFMQSPEGITALDIHPTNGLLYVVSDKITYYDWEQPLQPALGTIALPKGSTPDVINVGFGAGNAMMFMTDMTNDNFYYFNVNNPPETIDAAAVTEGPGAFYSSRHSIRIFVTNSILSDDYLVSILEAYYE